MATSESAVDSTTTKITQSEEVACFANARGVERAVRGERFLDELLTFRRLARGDADRTLVVDEPRVGRAEAACRRHVRLRFVDLARAVERPRERVFRVDV